MRREALQLLPLRAILSPRSLSRFLFPASAPPAAPPLALTHSPRPRLINHRAREDVLRPETAANGLRERPRAAGLALVMRLLFVSALAGQGRGELRPPAIFQPPLPPPSHRLLLARREETQRQETPGGEQSGLPRSYHS